MYGLKIDCDRCHSTSSSLSYINCVQWWGTFFKMASVASKICSVPGISRISPFVQRKTNNRGEHSYFWLTGISGRGLNTLGTLLMKLRVCTQGKDQQPVIKQVWSCFLGEHWRGYIWNGPMLIIGITSFNTSSMMRCLDILGWAPDIGSRRRLYQIMYWWLVK